MRGLRELYEVRQLSHSAKTSPNPDPDPDPNPDPDPDPKQVWRLGAGQCVRRFPKAHAQGVTCARFSRDGSQVVSGSFDQVVRVHGLKSGKVINEMLTLTQP